MALLQGFSGIKALYDIECYPNYISINFLDLATGQVIRFRLDPDHGIDERAACEVYFRSLSVVVSYNGHGYDDHVLDVVFKGVHCEDAWQHGDDIIRSGGRRYSPFLRYGIHGYPLSIDLAQVLAVMGHFPGLKALGNRFGYKHLQELPYEPGTVLTDQQKRDIDDYNTHDLNITKLVLERRDSAIEMRRKLSDVHGVNLTSHSDSGMGEAIIVSRYEADMNAAADGDEQFRLRRSTKTEWLCGGSDIISQRHPPFTTPALVELLDVVKGWTLKWQRYDDARQQPKLHKPSFEKIINLSGTEYKFKLGGLHSKDEPLVLESDGEWAITDIDVGSYYPGLIMADRIVPNHMNAAIFLNVYCALLDYRLAAKRNGESEIAQGVKIAINGVYGKFGSATSRLTDPVKGATVTINGQLCQLHLIERLLTIDGLKVLTANTDGVCVYHRRDDMDKITAVLNEVQELYDLNGFDVIDVIKICRATINDFVMAYHDPKTGAVRLKTKGVFNDGTAVENLNKKTASGILKTAAVARLIHGVPVEETIRGCRDITQFIDYATLDGVWSHIEDSEGNRARQRTNRWYEGVQGTILYKVGADGKREKFALMRNIVLANDLPDLFPDDVNYDFYVDEANKLVDSVLNPKQKRAKRAKALDHLTEEEQEELTERQTTELPNIEYLISLDLNHYRDLYLGKFKLNSYDSMKSVLARLWHDRDLRLTRADLIWICDSIDSGQGYFRRPDKNNSIISFIDYLVANAVPFEKDVFPVDDTIISATVDVLDDEPGGGKTRYALGQIVNGGPGMIYWWAINKIAPLASERHTELMALANATGVEIDFLAIHSDATGKGNMKMRVDARMKQINEHPRRDDKIFVTIITHRTLIDHSMRNVRGVLFIDEPTEVWEQRHFNFARHYRAIRQLIGPKDINDGYDSDINARVEADTQTIRLQLTDEGRQEASDDGSRRDSITGSYQWILEQADKTSGRVFATAEQWNALEEPGEGDLNVLALLHPAHIAHFEECWMMAAYFRELLIYQLWSDLYDVTWNFRPIDGGWTRTVPLSERVTIYYVLENRDVTDTYLTNNGDPKRRRAMARAVAEFYGDEPFIWSVNKSHCESGDYGCLPASVIGVDGENHVAYLTPKANGINSYQNLHGAAWLGSIKLSADLFDILGRVWGRSEARQMALVEYELYACLQFLSRANSRRFDSGDQVRYVVADYVQAAYVARMWNLPPDRVLPLPIRAELKAELDDVRSKGTGRKREMNDDELRERRRARSAKNRADKAAAEGREPKRRKPKKSQKVSPDKAA